MNLDMTSPSVIWLIDVLVKVTLILTLVLAADPWLTFKRKFVLVSALWRAALAAILLLPILGLIIPQNPGWIILNTTPVETAVVTSDLALGNSSTAVHGPASASKPETQSKPEPSSASLQPNELDKRQEPDSPASILKRQQKTLGTDAKPLSESQKQTAFASAAQDKKQLVVDKPDLADRECSNSLQTHPIEPSDTPVPASGVSLNFWHIVFATLIAGVLFFLARLIISFQGSRNLVNDSSNELQHEMSRQFADLKSNLQLPPHVCLLKNSKLRIPIVAGIVHPHVVVPADLVTPSDKRDRPKETEERVSFKAVILHELIHIKRHDPFWNLVARFATVIYWFHPLVWIANSRIAMNREKICDDYCVHLLGNSQTYVDTLISMASRLTDQPRVGLYLAAIRKPRLAIRIAALLNSRGTQTMLLSSKTQATINLFFLAAAILFASQSIFGSTQQGAPSVAANGSQDRMQNPEKERNELLANEQEAATPIPAPISDKATLLPQNKTNDVAKPSAAKPSGATAGKEKSESDEDVRSQLDQKFAHAVKDVQKKILAEQYKRTRQPRRFRNSTEPTHWAFGVIKDVEGNPIEAPAIKILNISKNSRSSRSGQANEWGEFRVGYSPADEGTHDLVIFKKGIGTYAKKLRRDVMPELDVRLGDSVKTTISIVDQQGKPLAIEDVRFVTLLTNKEYIRLESDYQSGKLPNVKDSREAMEKSLTKMSDERRAQTLKALEKFEKRQREMGLELKNKQRNFPADITENQLIVDTLPDDYGFVVKVFTKDGRCQDVTLPPSNRRHRHWPSRKDRNNWVAEFKDKATISGTVTYHDRTPIALHMLQVVSTERAEVQPDKLNVSCNISSATNQKGEYEVSNFTAGNCMVHLRYEATGFGAATKVKKASPGQVNRFDLQVFPIVVLQGKIADENNKPVEGAKIGFEHYAKTTTDADGNYKIFVPRELERSKTLEIDSLEGYISNQQARIILTEDILKSGEVPTYKFESARVLSGNAVMKQGSPAPKDTKVHAFWWQKIENGSSLRQVTGDVSEDGEFVLKDVSKTAPIFVVALSDRETSSELMKFTPDQETLIVQLDEPRVIQVKGRVVDTKGFPIKDLKLNLTPGVIVPQENSPIRVPTWISGYYDNVSVKTDATGEFKFPITLSRFLSYEIRIDDRDLLHSNKSKWFKPRDSDQSGKTGFLTDFFKITLPTKEEQKKNRFPNRIRPKFSREFR